MADLAKQHFTALLVGTPSGDQLAEALEQALSPAFSISRDHARPDIIFAINASETLRAFHPVPVIALVTSADVDSIVEHLGHGVSDFVTYPFKREDILPRALRLVKQRRGRDTAERLDDYVTGMLLDYLAIGLDPARTVIFAHSAVPALNQLLLPFLSLVTVPELNRNPTVKDEIAHSRQASVSGLMLTYPVHQAADILFCKANLVPVGQDQLPHLEIARLIARRFNERFGRPVFPVPDALLSAAPLLLGTDGTKMSKSRGNTIPLSATADETARLIRGATTDSERHISYDPERRPAVSSLVLLAALGLDRDPREVADGIGDGGAAALKKVVTTAVNDLLAPVRARRAEYARDLGYVREVLRDGNERANEIAAATLAEVQSAIGMSY